jgi:hypothetical protein
MRVPFALGAFLLLATFVPPGTRGEPLPPPSRSEVRFTPVALDDSDPGRRRLGGLVWLGAWKLTSNNPRFGGISAMQVEGRQVTAFSDSGWLFRFALPSRGLVSPAEIGPLPEGPGGRQRKSDRDIESFIVSGGEAWIGFERRNAIWRYDRSRWRAEGWAAPRTMRRWPANRGPEAMLRLADGRFIVFAEGKGGQKVSEAILFDGDPSRAGTPAVRMTYAKPAGYRTTDAALLPDGRALLLNRRFAFLEGVTAKLSLVDLAGIGEGAILHGEQLADFHRPVTVDNMEALSITREHGRTIVWIASDDNYLPLQQTLLMKFALADR